MSNDNKRRKIVADDMTEPSFADVPDDVLSAIIQAPSRAEIALLSQCSKRLNSAVWRLRRDITGRVGDVLRDPYCGAVPYKVFTSMAHRFENLETLQLIIEELPADSGSPVQVSHLTKLKKVDFTIGTCVSKGAEQIASILARLPALETLVCPAWFTTQLHLFPNLKSISVKVAYEHMFHAQPTLPVFENLEEFLFDGEYGSTGPANPASFPKLRHADMSIFFKMTASAAEIAQAVVDAVSNLPALEYFKVPVSRDTFDEFAAVYTAKIQDESLPLHVRSTLLNGAWVFTDSNRSTSSFFLNRIHATPELADLPFLDASVLLQSYPKAYDSQMALHGLINVNEAKAKALLKQLVGQQDKLRQLARDSRVCSDAVSNLATFGSTELIGALLEAGFEVGRDLQFAVARTIVGYVGDFEGKKNIEPWINCFKALKKCVNEKDHRSVQNYLTPFFESENQDAMRRLAVEGIFIKPSFQLCVGAIVYNDHQVYRADNLYENILVVDPAFTFKPSQETDQQWLSELLGNLIDGIEWPMVAWVVGKGAPPVVANGEGSAFHEFLRFLDQDLDTAIEFLTEHYDIFADFARGAKRGLEEGADEELCEIVTSSENGGKGRIEAFRLLLIGGFTLTDDAKEVLKQALNENKKPNSKFAAAFAAGEEPPKPQWAQRG